MTIETTPFDAAQYLTTTEAQAVFIRDALETGDSGYIAQALAVIARVRGDDVFGQQLRQRFAAMKVLGHELDVKRDQTPGEAGSFE